MEDDWNRVAEETFKVDFMPLRRKLFQMWLRFVGTRPSTDIEQVESLIRDCDRLEECDRGMCPNCDLPIDPDESYCILCRDGERDKRKRYLKACRERWKCVELLHRELKSFCGRFPLDKDRLAATLRTAVKKETKGRRTQTSIWSDFKEIFELLVGDQDHSGCMKLLKECCPSDQQESERKARRERIEDLHELVQQASVLGKIIEGELQRCRKPRDSKTFSSSRARYLQDLVTRTFTLDPHRRPLFS